MKNNQYSEVMSQKSTEELIELYRKGIRGKEYLVTESFEAVKAELTSRGLTGNTLSDKVVEIEEQDINTRLTEVKNNRSEIKIYSSLKTVAWLISALGYIVLIAGLVGLITFGQQNTYIGLGILLASIVTALPLFAFSNLIHVFIDIEYNTRMTSETIVAIYKKTIGHSFN
jgi:hypothetical protein